MLSNIKSHKELLIICTTEFFSCFSFFGTLSLMILFFVHNADFPQRFSYSLLGNFVASSFVVSLIGGYIGDRYLTFRHTCLLGLILYATGYFLLISYHHVFSINIGLTFVACGAGLFEPNIRNLLGVYYKSKKTQERNAGFTVLHVFNIMGQVTGPLVLAYLRTIHPSWMFIAAGISIVFGMLFFMLNYEGIHRIELSLKKDGKRKSEILKGIVIAFLLVAASYYVILFRDVRYVLLTAFILTVLFFSMVLPRMNRENRIKIYTIFFILIGIIAAEICFRQCFGVVDLFTRTYVNRKILHVVIPTGMFYSVEPFFILLIFYWIIKIRDRMEKNGHSPSAIGSISLGLFALGACFALLAIGITFAGQEKMSVIWLLACYFLMGIGELLIIPIATAGMTLSPHNFRGVMMGVFFLSSGISSYLSAQIGKFISPASGNPTIFVYRHLFLTLTVFGIIVATILYIVWIYWKRKYVSEMFVKS